MFFLNLPRTFPRNIPFIQGIRSAVTALYPPLPATSNAADLETWLTTQFKINNVTRDDSQGYYSNRVPLFTPDVLESFAKWNELNHKGNGIFGCIENGGAQPQVDENFLGQRFLDTFLAMRQAAQGTVLRPLWRGNNGWTLKPSPEEDLRTLLNGAARVVAPISHDTSSPSELLRIKAFDSQGNSESLRPTFNILHSLQEKGHPVHLEIAIPYSNGNGRDNYNPYPDTFYEKQLRQNLQLAQECGLLGSASPPVLVSIKDMIGDLSKEDAPRIIRLFSKVMKEFGVNDLGIHLHDTGLAKQAYLEAIITAAEEGINLNIDTVPGQNHGFVGTCEMTDYIQQQTGIPLISNAQARVLDIIEAEMNRVRTQYKAALTPRIFTGEEMRRYGIPGGGEGSFISAVRNSELDKKLNISFEQTCHLTGTMLQTVGKLAGHPLPVTPGFQNKQIFALYLLGRMEELGMFKGKEKNYEAILDVIREVPTRPDSDLEKLLANTPQVVINFLAEGMPAPLHRTLQKLVDTKVTKKAPEPSLPKIRKEISDLQSCEKLPTNLSEEETMRLECSGLILGEGGLTLLASGMVAPEPSSANFTSKEAWQEHIKAIKDVSAKGFSPSRAVDVLKFRGIYHSYPQTSHFPARNLLLESLRPMEKLQDCSLGSSQESNLYLTMA